MRYIYFQKWIGNQKAKERKRANQNVVDGKQDVVPQKISKGERKVAARSVFYRHLSKEGDIYFMVELKEQFTNQITNQSIN